MLARLVVEPHRDITSLMVIMLYCPASPHPPSHTGDSTGGSPDPDPEARLCSSSVSRPTSSAVREERGAGLARWDPAEAELVRE